MNPLQFLKFALHGLWRQKVRTALTLVGVTVGTCALAFSVALGLGLREFIETEFKGRDDFWRVLVRVDELPPDPDAVPQKDRDQLKVQGAMSPERAARIREMLLERYQRRQPPRRPKLLTPPVLAEIAELPDVSEVRTFRVSDGRLWPDESGPAARRRAAGAWAWLLGRAPASARFASVTVVSGPLNDLAPRLIAGRLPAAPGAQEVVVTEFALYQLGFRSDTELESALGRPLRLDVGGVKNDPALALARAMLGGRPPEELTAEQMLALKKVLDGLPQHLGQFGLTAAERAEVEKLLSGPPEPDYERADQSGRFEPGVYRVCGVVRVFTREEKKKHTPLDSWELSNGDVFLPPVAGDAHFNKLPWVKDRGVYSADVRVTPGGDLPATVAAIETMGFRTHSGAKWFVAAKREVTLIAAGLNLFAFIALFVAAVGITNTLVTSVIERTREIGILRAVGATRGQIMALFLLEGTLIGLTGALMGLGLAQVFAVWADDWVRGLIQKQMDGEKMLSTTIFVFPWWLWVGSVVFAAAVTTLAALYPAQRAAKIHPIEALRYA